MGANTLRDVTRTITDHIEPKIYPTVEKVVLDGKNCIKVVLQEKIFQKFLLEPWEKFCVTLFVIAIGMSLMKIILLYTKIE